MRRRSSPKVVWLPQDPANSLGASVYQEFILAVAGTVGDFAVGEIPLVIDNQADPLVVETTLADVESSGYRLRRVVGKIWAFTDQQQEDTPGAIIVTAGIIVRRADPATGASLAVETGSANLVSPGEIENTSDPWVWRRSWFQGNNDATIVQPFRGNTLPENNLFFSALDGPHVDQKTARLIGPEERLFLTVSATIVTGGMDQNITLSTAILTDLRVLGSMRTMIGNRRNASR